MQLTNKDRQSEVWKKLISHLNDLLDKAQRENEKTLDIEQTAQIRGRIKLIRSLLKLDSGLESSALTTDTN